MKNTVILDNQQFVYLVIESELRELQIHSAWRSEGRARDMSDILNTDGYSNATVMSIMLDADMPEKLCFRVLVNLNTGEQVEDDLIGMNNVSVCVEDNLDSYQHNFVMYDDPSEATIEGENPRKINGKWVIQTTDFSWEEFLDQPNYQEHLSDCLVYGEAYTKEGAIGAAREKAKEIIDELERKNELRT